MKVPRCVAQPLGPFMSLKDRLVLGEVDPGTVVIAANAGPLVAGGIERRNRRNGSVRLDRQ